MEDQEIFKLPTPQVRDSALTSDTKSRAFFNHDSNTKIHTALILLVEDNMDVIAYTASCFPDY